MTQLGRVVYMHSFFFSYALANYVYCRLFSPNFPFFSFDSFPQAKPNSFFVFAFMSLP